MNDYAIHLINQAATRSCQRKGYVRIYIVVKAVEPFALCDPKDGFVLAFTDWTDAIRASVPFRGYVTNWDEFCRRNIRAGMTPRPPAMRIFHTDKKGVAHRYHAEFDASNEELRTLNVVTPRDAKHMPDATRRMRKSAKVWEEIS